MDKNTWPVPNGTATLIHSPFSCEIRIRNVNGVIVKKFTGKTEAEALAAYTSQYPDQSPSLEAHQAAYDAWQAEQANGVH